MIVGGSLAGCGPNLLQYLVLRWALSRWLDSFEPYHCSRGSIDLELCKALKGLTARPRDDTFSNRTLELVHMMLGSRFKDLVLTAFVMMPMPYFCCVYETSITKQCH
jgi:hypothetical protein